MPTLRQRHGIALEMERLAELLLWFAIDIN